MLRMFQASFVLPYYNHRNIGIQTGLMRAPKTAVWGHHATYVLHAYSLFVIDARSFMETFEQAMNKILCNYFYSHPWVYNFIKPVYRIIYGTMSYRFI